MIAASPRPLTVQVCFVKPPGAPAGWERTSLWDAAARVPGVRVSCDEEGEEARRFGARTSGHIFLCSEKGDVLFSGGITSGRGQSGENGGQRLLALLAGQADAPGSAPVFGCPLFTPNRTCNLEDGTCPDQLR
jgi:hypothetical protein